MTAAEITLLLRDYGGWGVAGLAVAYGLMERKERQDTQRKFDNLAERLPEQLLGIVKETSSTLSAWTTAANSVLSRVRDA